MPRDPKKRDLIQSLPRDMPFSEVKKRARQAGLGTIGKSYLQKVRAEMRPTFRIKDVPTNGNGHGPPVLIKSAAAEEENDFKDLVRVIGTRRARALLEAYETQ